MPRRHPQMAQGLRPGTYSLGRALERRAKLIGGLDLIVSWAGSTLHGAASAASRHA